MKIDSSTTRLRNHIPSDTTTGNAPARPVAVAAESSANTALSHIGSISASGPGDFDVAKVQRVRSSIEAGTYKVDAGSLADGMIADAHAFLAGGVF